MPTLRLSFLELQEPVASRCHWYSESNTLCASFSYEAAIPEYPYEAGLSRSLGIKPKPYRLVIEDVDIVIGNDNEISSLELYTHPSTWKTTKLEALPKSSRYFKVRFEVDFHPANSDFTHHTRYKLLWDPEARHLAIRLKGMAPSQWFPVSDSVIFGADGEMGLAEIRLTSITGLPESLETRR